MDAIREKRQWDENFAGNLQLKVAQLLEVLKERKRNILISFRLLLGLALLELALRDSIEFIDNSWF